MIERSLVNWVLNKIKTNDRVLSAEIIEENIILIRRLSDESEIKVVTLSFQELNIDNVSKIVNDYKFDFLLNIKAEAYYHGKIYSFLDDKKKSFGTLGDLYRVIGQNENWPYLHRDVKFILRNLKQHSKVLKVERLDNKRLNIIRKFNLSSIIIVATNDYEVNAESLRKLKEDFNNFDAILASNPIGRITSQAFSVAEMMGVPLYNWSELYSELNKKWK